MPQQTNPLAYRDRLNPWAIACIHAEGQRTIVSRFRSRSDAEGRLQYMRQMKPQTRLAVVFDPQPIPPEIEPPNTKA